ncbi:sensor histidine kinase [Thermocatellispora tengchongensis]
MHERLQIARELHDVVANYMSIIAVQAGLGRYVARSDPPTSQQALDVIADTSHQALTEMRRLLSILRVETRDEEDLYAVPPGVRRLHWLVERMNRAGLTIEFTVHGTVRDLPPGLDLCVYRIVQESLTNTLKHAGRARAEVSLTYAPAELTVRVRDDGVRVGTEGVHVSTEGVPASLPPTDSGGHGLIGMAERVRLYEGSITTGPRPQGGYEVIAVFPLAGLPRLGQQADAGPSGAA